jgi:hypothetical protein
MRLAWLISRKAHKALCTAVAAIVLLAIAGCATVSRYEGQDPKKLAAEALPAEYGLYIYLDVPAGGPFLKQVLSVLGTDSGKLDRLLLELRSAYIGLDLSQSGRADWTCIGTGEFSAGLYASGLNFDRGWKRVYGSGRRWISTEGNLEIAFPTGQIVVAGSSSLDPVIERMTGEAARNPVAAPAGAAGSTADAFKWLLAQFPDSGFVVYLREPSIFMDFDLPPGISEGFTMSVSGVFNGDVAEADLYLWFLSQSKARIAGLLMKTVVLSQQKSGTGGPLVDAEVKTGDDYVSVGPISATAGEVQTYLKRMTAGNGGDE